MSRLATMALAAVLLAGCDTVRPDEPGVLVVEAFVETGGGPPPVRVSRTRALYDTGASAVGGAEVSLILDGVAVPYEESGDDGTYRPVAGFDTVIVRAGSPFSVIVRAGADRAEAEGSTPPALTGIDLSVSVPPAPVQAVLLDSLSLALDSLHFELPGRTGYVYPIVASLSWDVADPGWWVAARLEPRTPFSSTLLDYFLRPSTVLDETRLETGPGAGSWDGVYAVPVDREDAPVPEHDLVVTIVRGDARWAAYAASSGDPERREPVSNVRGGIGMVAGVSVLRQTVRLP